MTYIISMIRRVLSRNEIHSSTTTQRTLDEVGNDTKDGLTDNLFSAEDSSVPETTSLTESSNATTAPGAIAEIGSNESSNITSEEDVLADEEEIEETLEEWEEATAEHDAEWFAEYDANHNATTASEGSGSNGSSNETSAEDVLADEEEIEETFEEWEEATAEHDAEWFADYESTHNTTQGSSATSTGNGFFGGDEDLRNSTSVDSSVTGMMDEVYGKVSSTSRIRWASHGLTETVCGFPSASSRR